MKSPCSFLILISLFSACASPDKKPAAAVPAKSADPVADTVAYTKPKHEHPEVYYMGKVFTDTNIMSVPPYGLEKVKALLQHIVSVDLEDTIHGPGSNSALDDKNYSALPFDEKFTYNMIYPEISSQNCDMLPERTDEDHRIYGALKNVFGEYEWSDRQVAFFKDNKDSVEALMKILIEKNNRVGVNFREAIVEMNGTEMIPLLIDTYNIEKKDHYLLTVLMLLMEANKYPEFMSSPSYKKLYVHDEYSSWLVYTQANEALIIQRATNFYNGLSKK